MCGRHVCLLACVLALASPVVAQDWDFEVASTVKPPEIDGYIDAIWSIASTQYIAVPINGNPDSPANCSGSWQVLWDTEYLYVIVDVNDNSLNNDTSAGSTYLDDSVEVYFDGGNSKGPGAPLADDDRQYTFGWGADVIEGVNTNIEGVEHAQVDTDTGYRVEVKFPWTSLQAEAPQMGDLIGMDCFINDDDDGGDTREYQLSTFADDNGDWEHPSDWGTAVLARGSREKASGPSPTDKTIDVPRDVVLEWVAGEVAATHDVYLGTVLADVTEADRANPMDVLAGQDHANTNFDPPGLLEYGQTYYWRVDEVNALPDNTIFEGDIWSFTVEPLYYPVSGIIATASAPTAEGSGEPEVMVNDSGLTDGMHNLDGAAMWSGTAAEDEPIWLQFDFDRAYKLYGIHVWNFNGLYEFILGFGLKNITIEYATEPNVWTPCGNYELGRGTGYDTYAGERIDLDGVVARSIRINVNSTHYGGTQPGQDKIQAGVAEIQFLYTPVFAREPQPADGATEVDRTTSLSWRAGREAESHEIYFGADGNAVAERTTPAGTATSNAYDPGALLLGATYYWTVDEVNDAETPPLWDSAIWSFTTQEYISIDDFESYTDDDGNRVYQTWSDGYGVDENGSQVGHDDSPYAEKSIVHDGRQAMPFYYDNTDGVTNSQTEITFSPARDLTAGGADTLSLYYQGQPVGFHQVSQSHILMNGTGEDIWGTTDQFRFVYKQLTGNGSIVTRIDRLDNTNEWAKAGVMIRETLESDSVLVDGVFSADMRVCMQWRDDRAADMGSPDATSHTVAGGFTLPRWVKLTRTGDVFSVQHSADGQTWLDIVPETEDDPTSTTVAMPSTVYIGVAVCSHNSASVAGAEFSSIATTGNVTGQWQSAAIGVDQVAGNGVDVFYVSVEDSLGNQTTLTNIDPYAVTVNTWQQWPILLSDLSAAGVDPSRIATLALGVGDKTQPSQNTSGLLYIDDVGFGHPIPAEEE